MSRSHRTCTRTRPHLQPLALLGLLLVGCMMYDESLLVGSGGLSTGTGGEGSSSNLARGGFHSSTDGSGGRSGGSVCAGSELGGICWYWGSDGFSCRETCANHGGIDVGATTWVGTEAQGGSLTECAAILQQLGISAPPEEGFRTDGLGLGCMTYRGVPFWHASPPFDPDASMPGARLACGCAQ